MNIRSILDQCVAEGVNLSVESGKLTMTGQHAALDEWRPLLRSLRSELLEMMKHSAEAVQRRATAFFARGVDSATARTLALRLQTRDAQHDERRLCLECNYLIGAAETYRCAQWRHAGLSGPQLPRELPAILQRCKVFHPTNSKYL